MNHYAIIPARKGSKSIINKNLQKVQGKSLVEWSLEKAIQANIFKRIILSTDIPILIDSPAKEYDILHRSADLADDKALMMDVVMDVVKRYHFENSSYIWLLQPTSPFRRKEDFYAIKNLVASGKCNSVISVKDAAHNHPDRCYTVKQSRLIPLRKTSFKNKQDLKLHRAKRKVVSAHLKPKSCFLNTQTPYYKKET